MKSSFPPLGTAILLATVAIVMDHDDKLTVYEAARLVGCTSQWIRTLLAERRLPGAEKVAGQWQIPESALQPLKQRREVSA
jgi:excisionase family DNA binding protein